MWHIVDSRYSLLEQTVSHVMFALQYLQQLAATGQLGSTFPQPPSHPYLIPGAGGPQTQVIVENGFVVVAING